LAAIVKEVGTAGGFDALFLMTKGGEVLASWHAEGPRSEEFSVMPAMLTASVDVMPGELRRSPPHRILMETDKERFLVRRTKNEDLVVIRAPDTVSKRHPLAPASEILEPITSSAGRATTADILMENRGSRFLFPKSRMMHSRQDH